MITIFLRKCDWCSHYKYDGPRCSWCKDFAKRINATIIIDGDKTLKYATVDMKEREFKAHLAYFTILHPKFKLWKIVYE